MPNLEDALSGEPAVGRAARLGASAGRAYRDTGVPRRCPMPTSIEPLWAAWTFAYVEAAYRSSSSSS